MGVSTFYCIGDEDTVRGFRGVGVPGEVVTHTGQAAHALATACARPGLAILILTDTVADLLGPALDAVRFDRMRPLIVEIPGFNAAATSLSRLRGQVRAAAGFNLDWKEPGR
jgi:vacuolar-type H+-ATPase subunit F/Vma7